MGCSLGFFRDPLAFAAGEDTVDRPDADVSAELMGTWEQTDEEISIVLDSDMEGNELEEPVELLLVENEDGSVEGVEFDAELFGEELVLQPVEE